MLTGCDCRKCRIVMQLEAEMQGVIVATAGYRILIGSAMRIHVIAVSSARSNLDPTKCDKA